MLDDAAGAFVWIFAVALNLYALAWCWCVNELAIANVNAYVVSAIAPEYEVAWLEAHEGNRGAGCLLVVGHARDADAHLCVHILYKAAAVKA